MSESAPEPTSHAGSAPDESDLGGPPAPSARPTRGKALLATPGRFWAGHKLLILGIVAGVILIGVAAGWVITSSAQRELSDSLSRQLAVARSTITTKDAQIGRYVSQRDATRQALTQLKQDQAKLAEDQAALKAGQAALAAQTQLVQASQFSDGQYTVGQTVAPGVYRETAGGDCYYEWASSTASDASIVRNDIPQGPATVTLRAGDIFTSTRCGTWTKIG